MVKIYCEDPEMQFLMQHFGPWTEPIPETNDSLMWVHRRNKALAHWKQCYLCNSWLKKADKAKEKSPLRYFVTFTVDPSKGIDLDTFRAAVEKQLARVTLCDAYYVIEHIDTNMHAHCLVFSWQSLSAPQKQWHYMTKNVGRVDQVRVRKDNGISSYMSKENKPLHRICCGESAFRFE